MNIEVLLTEAEIAAEFAESMEARDLPEKFFYWTPFSVRAWKELSAINNESLRDTREALASRAGDLTKSFGGRVPVAGDGACGSEDGGRDPECRRPVRDGGVHQVKTVLCNCQPLALLSGLKASRSGLYR